MDRCSQEETIKEIKQKIEEMPNIKFVLDKVLESNRDITSVLKEQNKINQELKLTLTQLAFNLEALNIRQEKIDRRQEKTDEKIENIEKMVKETDDKTKIDLAVVQKNGIEAILTKAFGAVGVISIIYFILEKLGVLQ